MEGILDKVLRQKAIQWKDGNVIMWGLNGLFSAMFAHVYLQRVIEQQIGYKEAMKFFYWQGRFQGDQGVKLTENKFGYAEKLKDKLKRLSFSTNQTQLTGLGKFEFIKVDFENELFICQGHSSFAQEYKTFMGKQKHAIDFHMRGQMASIIYSVLHKDVFCIQTKCIGKGDKICEYVIKPKEKWDMTNPIVKEQFFEESYPEMKDLGENTKEPYLAYDSKSQ